MVPNNIHLQIGSLLFEGLDQIDLTGPFEIFSRIPNATYQIYAKTVAPVRDVRCLRLAPDTTLAEAPQLDLLQVPGGFGQEAWMEDDELLDWVQRQASGARCVFSVCTGSHLRRGWFAQGTKSDNALERVSSVVVLRRRSRGRTSGHGRESGLRRRRYGGYRWRAAGCRGVAG
jgi:hypothetical protein